MLVGLNKNVQNRLVGSAEGVFKSLFSLIHPFSVILGAWDGYQNTRSAEFIKELSERIALIEHEMSDLEQIFLSEFAKGKYKDKSRNDVYQNSDDSRAIALDALYTKGILKNVFCAMDTFQTQYLNRFPLVYNALY